MSLPFRQISVLISGGVTRRNQPDEFVLGGEPAVFLPLANVEDAGTAGGSRWRLPKKATYLFDWLATQISRFLHPKPKILPIGYFNTG